MSWHQELREERDRRLKNVYRLSPNAAGRAYQRFEIYEDLLRREVKQRIQIYGAVCNENDAIEMFSSVRLSAFQDVIMTTVGFACLALRDRNEADFRAAGDPGPFPPQNQYDALKGKILTVVSAELDVLRAEGRMRGASQLLPSDEQQDGSSSTATLTLENQREAAVKMFLHACNSVSQDPIVQKHIWRAVHHRSPRQFQYWKAGDSHATKADDENFRRILSMTPSAFIEFLKSKKLL